MKLQDYHQYNSSFKKKFIYRLGASTGFFSEYNNMVLAMHYCLVNHIQFILESENANFSAGEGWNEFFVPFCSEIRNKWLRKFNRRIKPPYKNRYEWIAFNLFKRMHPNYIYMYTLFDTMRKTEVYDKYDIKEVGLYGNLLKNCSEIHKMIWKYNDKTSKEINAIIQNLVMPTEYIGMHIRQGDKKSEAELQSPEKYMEHARSFSDLKDVFVLTDDFSVIIRLKEFYPNYHFYTLCQENEDGYDFARFRNRTQQERKDSYLRLWASMDILEKSEFYIGTYSANPGMNMGFRMETDRIKCIDYDDWQLW